MGIPGEDIVSTAIDKFADGVMKKMDEDEERRDREFTYRMKELDFYKNSYEQEIKRIFDDWFTLLQDSLLSINKNLAPEQQRKYKAKFETEIKPDKIMVLKINTMKYGGTDTGKALALYSQISFEEDDDKPELTTVYAICFLLSTLKREILGQEIEPITILQILLNDYSFNKGEINDSRCYVEEFGKNLFSEEESSEERND